VSVVCSSRLPSGETFRIGFEERRCFMRALRSFVPSACILLTALLLVGLAPAAAAGGGAGPQDSYREIRPAEEGLLTDPPLPEADRGTAWLTCPTWRMLMDDYGYSDNLLARKPHWLRRWPYYYWYFWDPLLCGEWAAGVYYDQVQTPTISMGPNAGQRQTQWLEPNFLYPNWATNSGFFVMTPIATWNRGHLPPGYLDTGYSSVSDGQIQIDIDYYIWDDYTAMGRCFSWPWPWQSWVRSDRYVLQQVYTVTNITTYDVDNLEFYQFLHSHPGSHNVASWWGDWEVYDPFRKWQPWDPWDTYHYDITQWGRQYQYTWPWIWPFWNWWGYQYVGFSSDIQPNSFRSPSPWGLGDYVGHTAGKPPRPGTHWDVEESNLNPYGGPCTLYPLWGWWPIYGSEVAGAEAWYLDSTLNPGESVTHDVLLSISNRPHHGWHWGYDWWYWYDWYWPYWIYPSHYWTYHDWGYPYYRLWVDYPWWWRCWYWPRPYWWPIWFGIALPHDMIANGLEVEGVYFKEYAPEGGGPIQAEFVPSIHVTMDLQENFHWDEYEWFGYELRGYELPDSMMVAYVALRGDEEVGPIEGYSLHAMMGDSVFGWCPDHYDSSLVYMPAGAPEDGLAGPTKLHLAQNDPNPFGERTEIAYSLPAETEVKLVIYDLAGRVVRTLVDARQEAGEKVVPWDGKDESGTPVAGGVYFYKLVAGDRVLTKKMAYLK
jgi:hypothetical protein